MKLLKPGFIQKAICLLIVFLEVVGLVGLVILFIFDAFGGNEAYIFYGITALAYVFSLLTSFFIVNTKVADIYKLSWLVVVVALPIIGVLLYVVFANRTNSDFMAKKYSRFSKAFDKFQTPPETIASLESCCPEGAKISKYLQRANGSSVFAGTQANYYPLGDDAFPVMIQELRKAKHYIFFEYFIIEPGVFFDAILDVLAQKAQQGVDVRMMYDDVGCLGTVPARYYQKLQKMGIKAQAFNKLRPLTDIRLNNRDHRKILVIDGHTGFTGGINIADEYINQKVRFGHWKDNAIMLKGEAVYGLTRLFLSNWSTNFDKRAKIDYEYYLPSHFAAEAEPIEPSGFVQPYGDLPYDKESTGYDVYFSIISQAKNYVYMTTPYLMIDKGLETVMIMAAKQGVDVRLITPHIPDKKTVFQITRSYYGPLLKAGVKIFEYTPGFVHEKMFIADDKMATVGTINLDSRSLYLHLECGTLLVGTNCIADMKKDFVETQEKCEEIHIEEWEKWHRRKKLSWGFLRVLSPFL